MKTKTLRMSVIVLSVLLAVLLIAALVLTFGQNPGTKKQSGWQEGENGRYYLDSEYNQLSGWQEIDGKTYYFDPYLHTGWLTLEDGTYFLNDDGNPITGLFPCPQGSYYFAEDGKMVTGWADTEDGKRYFAEDGTMTVGFLDLDGKRYCFDQGGILCIGWKDLQGQRFYFDETGAMVTTPGWLRLDEGTWFLNEDGQPYTGWMQTDEARYYFLEDGKMATGAVKIADIARFFSSDGNYIPLVNPWNSVPEDYELRLVTVEGLKVDSTCSDALLQMMYAARDAKLTCVLNSTYRDMTTQTYLWNRRYNDYISKGYSEEEAYRLSARRVAYPGTSEHHTGLAIDITGSDALYQWFRDHAWEYGFTVRYKGEKEELTGIKDEPWHLRYVGKEVAQILQENDWCLEEFWNEHYK